MNRVRQFFGTIGWFFLLVLCLLFFWQKPGDYDPDDVDLQELDDPRDYH